MFHGENLTNLRVMNGMSRKQLSDRLDVTEQAVWQYENNYTSPKLQTINTLREMFCVKPKYFYAKDVLQKHHAADRINLAHIAYRSKMYHAIFKTRAEAKHLEFLDLFVDELTAFMTYPALKIIKLRDTIINYLNTTNDPRDEQIETCAKVARESLGLSTDTNSNLLFLIEKSGVFLFEKSIGEKIDAYSLWTEQNRPYIMLGNKKRSAVRRNFDIAHELGHLLLHYKLEFANMDGSEHKQVEKEANTFACAFLLPADRFTTDMQDITRVTNPDAYIDVKEKWNTSLQVVGYRAANLGLIEAKQHRNFYAALHRRGYLQWEPLDDVLKIQKPMKVKSMIEFASKNGLFDLPHMLEQSWKVELSFISRLTGIEQTFLEPYVPSFHVPRASVTHLSRINGQ